MVLPAAAAAASCSQIRNVVLIEKQLKSAMFSKATNGLIKAFDRFHQKRRYSRHVYSKVVTFCSHSEGGSDENLKDEVAFVMDYKHTHTSPEHEELQPDSDRNLKSIINELDVLVSAAKFSAIVIGNTSPIELYDEIRQTPGVHENLVVINHTQTLPSLGSRKWIKPSNPDLDKSLNCLPDIHSDRLPTNVTVGHVLPFTFQSADQFVNQIPELVSEEGLTIDSGSATKKEIAKNLCTSMPEKISLDDHFDSPIGILPGIKPRQRLQLEENGFHTIRKLLNHFPRTYADIHNADGGVDDGQFLIFVGKVTSSRGVKAGSSFSFVEVVVSCHVTDNEETLDVTNTTSKAARRNIHLHLKKYFSGARFSNHFFLKKMAAKYQEGDLVSVTGKVKAMSTKDHFEVREYSIDFLEEDEFINNEVDVRPYPVYPSKGGLKPDFLKTCIRSILDALSSQLDPIPEDIRKEFSLISLHDAYIRIHCPRDMKEADTARRRLLFDEFFYLQLGRLFQMHDALGTPIEKEMFLEKIKQDQISLLSVEELSDNTKEVLKSLPYTLTESQLQAALEIIWDLRRPVPMNRLLQGDVACGKTVVAFLACLEVISLGYQVAFMVPTELLALQHYEHLLNLLKVLEEQHRPSVAFLTGSTASRQSRIICEGLRSGEIDIVIGTHSLISDNIEFHSLKLAVIDEQHRFGVVQRGKFNSKLYSILNGRKISEVADEADLAGKDVMAPHILSISATPIPRTLAKVLCGDMSLSQITGLPPGRLPVTTLTIEGNQAGFEKIYQIMQEDLETGGKVYLVYPAIEESEQLPLLHAAATDFDSISEKFPDYNCGLLHGRMDGDEKEDILRKFRTGEVQILLATQVIEIGVDIPDASLMVVMNAERFGIAQLHQLRGRVGRGSRKSTCIFLSSSSGSLKHLKILENSSDGFYLANVDLLHRGPGDLLGKKQSGHLPSFPITRLELDKDILKEAQLAAVKILESHHGLETLPKLKRELSMRQPLCLLGD